MLQNDSDKGRHFGPKAVTVPSARRADEGRGPKSTRTKGVGLSVGGAEAALHLWI